jgi:hypothetical protein
MQSRRILRNTLRAMFALSLCAAAVASAGDKKKGNDIAVANEGGIRDKWMLADGAQLAAPGYPAEFAPDMRNVCMALGYKINPDGTTSDFQVLKQWNSATEDKEPQPGFWEAFARAGAAAVGQWRFKPRPEVTSATPVFTVATLNFQATRDITGADLRAHCKIDDLATLMQKQKKSGMNDHQVDNENRARDAAMRSAVGNRP